MAPAVKPSVTFLWFLRCCPSARVSSSVSARPSSHAERARQSRTACYPIVPASVPADHVTETLGRTKLQFGVLHQAPDDRVPS